jgi:peptidoglycan hydrolase-like protein with peptidoglycan-binding domain
MRSFGGVSLWLPLVLLTACATSRTEVPTPGALRAAYGRMLTRGDIQVAEAHLQAFGYDPVPVDGLFTAQTQAAVRAFQRRYGLSVSGPLDYGTRLKLVPGLDPTPRQSRGGWV